MNPEDRYDIDRLLLAKPFDKLTAEEQAYAIDMCDTPQRYAALKEAALRLKSEMDGDTATMPGRTKRDVMAAFDKKHEKKGRAIALWQGERAWYAQPAFRMAAAVAVLFALIWALPVFESSQPQLAENKISLEADSAAGEKTDTAVVQEQRPETQIAETKPGAAPTTSTPDAAKPEPELVAALREEAEQSMQEKDTRAPEENYATIPEPVAEIHFESGRIADAELADTPDLAQAEDVGAEMDVAVVQKSSSSMAPASLEAMEVSVARRQKKAKEETPFDFRLSNRRNWKARHYTAW